MKRIFLLAGAAFFIAGSAQAYDYPTKMTGKAKIACDFEADLVFQHKQDMVEKYVTPDFVEHHLPGTVGIPAFKDTIKGPQMFGPKEGCGGAAVVIEQGDWVTFIRGDVGKIVPPEAGKEKRGTHFDIWRFEGDKIAEHWD